MLARVVIVALVTTTSATHHSSEACISDDDCSLNGECVGNVCVCDAAWIGPHCSSLNFRPANPFAGYRGGDPGVNRSSWGGGGWYDETDNVWYMWVSELADDCGMATWTTNSQTVRASSSDPVGVYRREAVQFPVWTHESIVTRGPAGEYVAFMSYNVHSSRVQCQGCSGGCTNPNCTSLGSGISNRDPTYMSWAPAGGVRGNWSEPVLVLQDMPQMDTNMAAVIDNSGRLLGMWRDHHRMEGVKGKSTIHLVTADDWKDNTTYKWTTTDLLFGDRNLTNPGGVEDPFIWIDARGKYHAVFHMLYPGHPYSSGGHAYSHDGLAWSWTGVAYDGNVTWADDIGADVRSIQANGDRPHLLFDKSGRTPVALTNSASVVGWSDDGMDADQTFTLLRPLNTAASASPHVYV